ncbi:acyl-CoA dehydrogenase NM domain-like protein [Delitschia confertaspora ATCC 74209]|uniref:Acyl-CoA dehydrogenase NM domain-like protein n=1 Tax=Delitschia confertaspora ATCC 74209 TaxID=1513339 RepID=A0A9P4JFT8_9PLEO|nr:acyl-CoA dehydrogenase NM domain-like protein [Delitschia confertaspora ATCC 74209]
MIDFTLSESQTALRNGAKQFAETVLSTAPALYNQHSDQRSRFESTLPIYRTAIAAGLIRGQIPVPLGGTATSPVDAALVVEEFYAIEPSVALTILGTGLGLTPLIMAGSKEQHDQFLKPFLSGKGEPLAAFVHSEPGGTANWLEEGAEGLGTTAWREGEEWIVNGEKLWTTSSAGWDKLGAELQCVVCRHTPKDQVPPSNPQTAASKILILLITRADIAANDSSAYTYLSEPTLLGHKSASSPHTRFTNFRVPAANLLAAPDGTGAKIVELTFGTSAAIVGAMSVGIMRAAFEAALSFAKSDTRGGKVKIIKRQSVADKLMDIKMRVEAARMLTWKAMSGLEREGGSWESKLEACLEAKIWCSEQVVPVVTDAMAVVGMKSYAGDQPFSRLLENAACLPLFDGGNLGVRRRQLERIIQSEGYEPWAGTYPPVSSTCGD